MSPQSKRDPFGTSAVDPASGAFGPSPWGPSDPAEVGLRELTHHTGRVLSRVENGERLIVTRHACPIAVLISVAEAEHFLTVHAARMVRARIEGRRDYLDGWGVPLDELP